MDLGIFETALPTQDIERTLAFYEGFGFARLDGAVETGTFTIQRGDCRLSLYQSHLKPDRLQLIFWQGDVVAIAEHLSEQNVAIQAPLKIAEDGGASLMILDPDGHPMFFITMPNLSSAMLGPAQRSTVPEMTIGLFELSLVVQDIQRSMRFYSGLGFRPVSGGIEERRLTMHNRDCRICLYQGHLDPAETQLIFWQGKVATTFKACVQAGGVPEPRFENGPMVDEAGHQAGMLRDPDGQLIYLINIPGPTR